MCSKDCDDFQKLPSKNIKTNTFAKFLLNFSKVHKSTLNVIEILLTINYKSMALVTKKFQ